MALFRGCPNPCGFRHNPLDPAVQLSRLTFSYCSCQDCLLQTIPECVKSCTNPLLKAVGKEQSLHAPVNNSVIAIWPLAGIVNKLVVWLGCRKASSRELQPGYCAQGWSISSQRPLHVAGAGGPAGIQGRSVETFRNWFMTIKRNLLLHWRVLPGQCQAAARGSGVMLAPVEPLCPWLPREMIPVQGHARQEVALLFVTGPRVLLQQHSLAWVTGVQCQVIGVCTALLQPNSLPKTPFPALRPIKSGSFPQMSASRRGGQAGISWLGLTGLAWGAGRRLSITGTDSSQTEMSCSSPQPYEKSLQSSNCPQLLLLLCLIHQESQPELFDSPGRS